MDFSDASSIFSNIKLRIKQFQFGGKAQLAFLEDLSTLINDGIPANRAIEIMAQSTTGISQEVALTIAQKISEGQALAEGMRGWFSPNMVEIIRVGEQGGVLGETMTSAIKTLTQSSSALGVLLGAIAYPILVIVMACVVIVYLNDTVFIQFAEIKPMNQWPSAGRDFVSAAHLIKDWWWLVVLFIIAVIIGLKKAMSDYTGEFRSMLDTIPPFSLYRRFVAARLMETLGLLVANGVVFKNAIQVMQAEASPYLASHLMMMEHLLSMGKGNVADILSTGLIDQNSILRLRVMAEVKGFEHGLIRLGVRGAEETTRTMKIISRIIGGMLMIGGAWLILVIIRGIYLTGMSLGTVGA